MRIGTAQLLKNLKILFAKRFFYLCKAFVRNLVMNFRFFLLCLVFLPFICSCQSKVKNSSFDDISKEKLNLMQTEEIVLGAGCFWCTEAVFERIQGVLRVEVGFMGGKKKNPSYRQIISTGGNTGEIEVAKLTFDPSVVSLKNILSIFWGTHDPTTYNRQGNDVGPQYRSAIFYASDKQKNIAEASLKNAQSVLEDPIVTEIRPIEPFYKAENYHQNYFRYNKNKPYCKLVISPKVEKLKKHFADMLKKE